MARAESSTSVSIEQNIHAIATKPGENAVQSALEQLHLDGDISKENLYKHIEDKILSPGHALPDHWLPVYQTHWEHHLQIPSLLYTPSPDAPTTLSFVRTGLDGRVTGCVEVPNPRKGTGLTSTSLERAHAPAQNFVRGRSGHVPFWPGGLDVALSPETVTNATGLRGLRRTAPGLSRGLRFGDDDEEEDAPDIDVRPTTPHSQADGEEPAMQLYENGIDNAADNAVGTAEIDDLLPVSRSNLRMSALSKQRLRRKPVQKRDWAHVVDVNKPMNNFHELVPEMAHKYPFELDTFQKEAVYHLEMGDSVFVAAHTSAGKTVVAEYAIALAEKHMTRAIYTSPIKALSNQKFRDFKQTFSSNSVGILTGDVQINPEANCLVMTTEILRSMLYKGADLIRDVEFVIFDEVHYVNDAERGVVWEEVIIMLPEHVSIILLSATVPNTKEFADWVGRTKKKDIYVISTPQRPVPLEHYLYASREMYKILDASGHFLQPGYKDAGEAMRRKQDKEREAAGLPPVQRLGARAAAPQRGQRGGNASARGGPVRGRAAAPVSRPGAVGRTIHQVDKNLYVHLLGHLRKKALLPVVIFTFSKRRCEEYAGTLTNVDLSTAAEKSEVHVTVEKALSRLKEADRKLPQIRRMRDLLSRGVGVHHGGLLPIVKEVVEILFARGLVKVLFATETFAMGVNMPAKCVVFSGIRKHDGRNFRELQPGEYTQMAGRAGRRGLDTTGTVIIIAGDQLPEVTTLTAMMLRPPSKLQSQFRLTYNMILNLLRVEALKVEEMIKRSFSENASQRLLPDQVLKITQHERNLATLQKLDCQVCRQDIQAYYDVSSEVMRLNGRLMTRALETQYGTKVLSSGRVVILRDSYFHFNAAVLLRPAPIAETTKQYYFLVLVDPESKQRNKDPIAQTPPPEWRTDPKALLLQEYTYQLETASLESILLVTDQTMKIDVPAIVDRHLIRPMQEAVSTLHTLSGSWAEADSIPEVNWSRMRQLEFQEILQSRDRLAKRTPSMACLECENFQEHYAILHEEMLLKNSIVELKMSISDQNLDLIPDYEQRIDVLKELGFVDANSTVLLKGRVACEVNSADELILTELILENTLAAYEPEEVVALLSCFVFQEKTDVDPDIPPKLDEGREAILAIADKIGAVQDRHKVATADSREKLKFGLVEVVYEWAKGMPFEQITSLTDVAEGTIVRVITRLDETCREVRDAARVIGDATLMKKMEDAQIKIKRDIVFAASLYF